MRLLTESELFVVAGGTGVCTPSEGSGNDIAGVKNSKAVGGDFINIYEGVVAATSHVIERVASAF